MKDVHQLSSTSLQLLTPAMMVLAESAVLDLHHSEHVVQPP
jgi:hypothetical protein